MNERARVPSLDLTEEERRTGTLTPASSAEAARSFRVHGCLLIKNVFPVELIESLARHFFGNYRRYLEEGELEDALTVGTKRRKVSVALEGPFNSPAIYASRLVLPIITSLLGQEAILASLVSVVALPGAPDQGLHRDHPWLFGQVIDRMIPSYAIKLIAPLVDLNKKTGTTLMVPGTHVLFDDQALTMAVAAPDLARGDCLLMDYRLLHQGTANRSSKARPILFLGYTRPWFHDRENFKRQSRLIIEPQARAQIPAAYRRLFLEPGKAGLREDEP